MDQSLRHQFPVLLLVTLLAMQVTAQQGTGGLFPPVSFTSNFASMTEVLATSTCRSCTGDICPTSSCNVSCPFGQDLPSPFRLLETGIAFSGVERTDDRGSALSGEDAPFIYSFDGSSESFINITEELSFLPSMGLTITGWVQQDQLTQGYVFAKTTVSGNTTFYALYLNSTEQRAYFEYRQENLTEGYRTLNLYNVNLADGDFHHFAVAVYGTYFALFVDGRLHRSWMRLDGVLHDKQGMLCVGKKQNNTIRYAGFMHSLLYFNSTLSDNDISMLAMVAPLVHTQPDCRCPPTHPVTRETVCEEASGNSEVARVNMDTHHPSLINDGNFATWWQGELGVAPVNVTISLDGLRAALIVAIRFRSAQPQSMVIHYSSDNGASFSPRQYYSANCSRFDMADNDPLNTARDVNCVTSESSSLQNQMVNFRVLDTGNRPEADNYVCSSSLQAFARATHIRLELVELNSVSPTDQYFAIDEVLVSGQECLCNGHADTCMGSICDCQHNTMGTNCEQCLPLFNNKPWRPGSLGSANECEACECNNHADSCVYNPGSNAGQCNCKPNFTGRQCQNGYYNTSAMSSISVCLSVCLSIFLLKL